MLSGGTVILKGIRKHESGSILDMEKTSGNSLITSLKSSITNEDQPAPWRSNVMSRRCSGRRSQRRKKLVCWSVLRRPSGLGHGVFGDSGGSADGGLSLATGMLS